MRPLGTQPHGRICWSDLLSGSDLARSFYGDIGRPICTYYGKIADLPPMLYENGFLEVSRSDVVNMKYVRSIRSYRALLKNGVELR